MALLRTRLPDALLAWRVYAALVLPAALGLWLAPRAPSPVVDAAADVWERLRTSPVRAASAPRFSPTQLDRSGATAAVPASPFKKIVVLVMETMTAEKLELERRQVPIPASSTPAARTRTATSATSPITRTAARACWACWVHASSLTRPTRRLAAITTCTSASAARWPRSCTSSASRPPSRSRRTSWSWWSAIYAWQHLIHLDDRKLAEARRQGLLCFVPYEFEHSCEDRALLPEVLAFLDAHERAFLYLEFIWGHASEYNDASGKSNTAYYSSYVDAVIEHLRARGTLDETLIVLTSDHGFRDKALQDRLGVYRIPLWFYATRFTPRGDARLFSHLDFKDLLHHERSLGAAPVTESPS